MKTPFLAICAAVAVTTFLRAEHPNIVLVMADDQGWGDVGFNGHPVLKTPNLDAFSREGIRFDQFHAAAPVCSPTRGSVLTGRTPNRYGTFQFGSSFRPQEITIAQVLKQAGYRTGHFGKWHLGSVQSASPVSPGACGFDEWVSSPNFFDLDPILSDKGKATSFKGDSSDITVDVALKFIRQCAEQKQPFLTVIWFGSPHAPHEALLEDRALYGNQPAAKASFFGELTALDRAFGRLRKEINDLGLRDRTLLWYNSDNGALPKVGSAGARRGFKGEVYEGGLLVPCIIEWPARLGGHRVITTPCVTSDILPTVLDIIDQEPPPHRPLDGTSLLPLLDGTEPKRSKAIGFWDWKRDSRAVNSKTWMQDLLAAQQAGREPDDSERIRPDAAEIGKPLSLSSFPGHSAWLDGDWKLHRIEDAKSHDVQWELYDLARDPEESTDVFSAHPERVAEMREALTDWLESVARSYNGEDYADAAAK